ncbi:MAG: response regulator, partial [Verrucomicrobiota bacterium]
MFRAMNNPIRILHLEDSRVDAEVVRGLLSHSDVPHQIRQVSTGPDFQQALQRETFDVVLCDFQIPGFGGRQALEMVRQSHPELQRFRTMGFKTIVSDLKAIFLAVPSRSERDTATSRRHFPRME